MSFIMSKLPKVSSMEIPFNLSLMSRLILFTLFSLLISIKILLLTNTFYIPKTIKIIHLDKQPRASSEPLSIEIEPPRWLEVIQGNNLASKSALRIGLINFEANQQSELSLAGIAEPVLIDLNLVSSNITWKDLFPGVMSDKSSRICPEIPMPKAMKYPKLDVVVAQLPCRDIEGIRDVHRLQISLASANLIVENAIRKKIKNVYGVFIAKCEPMMEMFRCDDLIWHEGDYWIYKPKVEQLQEFISMPLGACNLARPYSAPSLGRNRLLQTNTVIKPRQAYVTMLHSSESYVCGAIALAQSILLTNTTKDLVLLADKTVSNHSITGLQAAGWKVKLIERIRSPYAKLTDYNAWNYSKLRVWQLTEYSKVMFIDSDFIVLRNIDHFFDFPQISAAPDHDHMFNSGIMIVEPSECLFRTLMGKRFSVKSYNGGDQGYLNEVLTYWHRLTKKLNRMKIFEDGVDGSKRVVPKDPYAIHFFGFKPWSCYRDYDCNWDIEEFSRYASDDFHALWWEVHDGMSIELQMHCGLTKKQDEVLRYRRVLARSGNHSDEHWKIEVNDPRQFNFIGSV